MTRSQTIFAAKCAVALCAVPILIFAYEGGPDPRNTGAPGDTTCAQATCHVGNLNTGPGFVGIGFSGGSTYKPGLKQRLTVIISDPNALVYGFQASSRPESSPLNGQAGTFTPIDGGTFVLCEDGGRRPLGGCRTTAPLEFIEHNMPRREGRFEFDWTPPAAAIGPIKFYVAGNAANGNGQNSGDFIYTAEFTLAPDSGGAPPTIRANGVVNGASFQPGIVSGSWVTIFGDNLAPVTRIWNAQTEILDGRLPTELDGVRVNINGKPAAVYFISPTQINVQAPSDPAVGPVQVEVVNRNGSVTTTAQMVRAAPAFFLFDPDNRRYLAAVHRDGTFLGRTNLFPGLTTRPARPGDVVLLFGTGFGPTNPAVPSGVVFSGAAPTTDRVRVRIGGVDAPVAFAGLSGAGLYQLNVTIPDVPNGDQPVVAEVGGLSTPATGFITIQR